MTIPEKPSSINQRFRLTSAGRSHLKDLGLEEGSPLSA